MVIRVLNEFTNIPPGKLIINTECYVTEPCTRGADEIEERGFPNIIGAFLECTTPNGNRPTFQIAQITNEVLEWTILGITVNTIRRIKQLVINSGILHLMF